MSTPIELYVFALGSAVFWGLQPVAMKQGFEHGGTSMLAALVTVCVSITLFTSFTSVRYGISDVYFGTPLAALAIFLAGGIIGTGLGRLVLYTGIDRVGASVNTAVVNSRPLFASILAVSLLGEPLSLWLAAGIVAVTAGVVALSFSRGGDVRGWQTYELVFPLTAAIAYASGNIIRRFGFSATDLMPLSAVLLNEIGAGAVVVGYAVVRYGTDILAVPKRAYGYFVLGGLFSSGGLLSMFVALSLGPVIIVDPLSGTAPLFTALFAYVLLRDIEDVTGGVVLGAILTVIGVTLVTIAYG